MSWTRVFCFAATGLIAAAPFCKKQLQAQSARTTIVVRAGDAAPDGNGTFISFDHPVINDAGQTMFRSTLINTAGGANDNVGAFRSDGDTLVEIVRKGDSAPDNNGTFSDIGLGALNDTGQVAFEFNLSDGNGIAIWAIPEPTTLALVFLGVLPLIRCRRGL